MRHGKNFDPTVVLTSRAHQQVATQRRETRRALARVRVLDEFVGFSTLTALQDTFASVESSVTATNLVYATIFANFETLRSAEMMRATNSRADIMAALTATFEARDTLDQPQHSHQTPTT